MLNAVDSMMNEQINESERICEIEVEVIVKAENIIENTNRITNIATLW